MAGQGKQKKVVKTKKRQVEITLPETSTPIYQSNRVTDSRGELTLMQLRLFLNIMKIFQEPIRNGMDGKDWMQLPLFSEQRNPDYIEIPISLSEITDPRQYKALYEAALDLQSRKYFIPSELRQGFFDSVVLFTNVSAPIKIKGASTIFVTMNKPLAEYLIRIDRDDKGRAIKYTKYLYEVAIQASSKYTVQLYIKISSWKKKGGFRIKLDDLRQELGLAPDEYPNFADFKKRILIPAQNELEKKADCWFYCDAKGFEVKEGRKVVALNFKIVTPELEDQKNDTKDYVINLLKSGFGYQTDDLRPLEPLFRAEIQRADIFAKLMELSQHIKEKAANNDPVNDVPAYVTKSLLNEFINN